MCVADYHHPLICNSTFMADAVWLGVRLYERVKTAAGS